MRILEYAKKKIFRRADAGIGIGRDRRFLESLTAKSLDDAWAILADGAENKWADYENFPNMMVEARKRMERSPKAKNKEAIELIILIGERNERQAVNFLLESGCGFMCSEWVSNCLLAAILSGQNMLADAIGRGVAERPHLLKGASLPGVLPKFKTEARELSAKKGHHGHGGGGWFWQSTPLLAAISVGHLNLAFFLISKGLALEGSAFALGERSKLLGKTARSGKFKMEDAPSLVLGFAICEKRESVQLALIDRIKREGASGIGWKAVGSSEVLKLAARHGQEKAAIALMGAGGEAIFGHSRRKDCHERTTVHAMGQAVLHDLDGEVLREMMASNMNRAAGKLVGIASRSGDPMAIEILDAKDALEMRSVAAAVSHGNEKLALQLIAAGADVKDRISARDSRSVAHLAAEKEMEEVLCAIIKALGSSRQSGSGGSEPWEFMAFDACMAGQGNVARRLIKAGAPLKARMRDGFASGPLGWPSDDDGVMLAIIDQVREMMPAERSRILEEAVCGVKSINGFGPLAEAVTAKGAKVVKALIQAGASVENAKAQVLASKPWLAPRLEEILAEMNPQKMDEALSDASSMAARASNARLAMAQADDMSGREPVRSVAMRARKA